MPRRTLAQIKPRMGALRYKPPKWKSVVKRVKKLERRPELKFFDTASTSATLTTTPVITHLTGVPDGVNENERVGRRIDVKSLAGRVQLLNNANDTLGVQVRTIVFSDRMNTGTAPITTELFASATPGINDFRLGDLNTMKRFKVWYDRVHLLNPNGRETVFFKMFKRFKFGGLKVLYTGVAGTDEGKNSLYVMRWSDDATNSPSYASDWRIRFIDS